ncbi:50S ribosomal protein L7/L12 [Patescibacteria group bacterium]|nr:50S ribosomal protein L7/L12 [Patescibacteria group bacterium]
MAEETKEETKEKIKEENAGEKTDEKKNPPAGGEVPKKFKSLVESIEKLSVLDLSELVKILEEKFGVSATAPVVLATPAGEDANGEEVVEEKSSYNIILSGVGDQKIEVIKAVRDVTEKGLKEAKDLVDAVASGPQVVKEGANKEETDELKKKFETAGATIELQ